MADPWPARFFPAFGFSANLGILISDSSEVRVLGWIDLTQAHFWDLSAVGALDRVVLKLRAHGAEVVVIGLNEASDTLIERLGKHRNENASLAADH